MMTRFLRSLLEVERKFKPDADFVRRLESNCGAPAFRSVRYLGVTTFEDAYFDAGRTLLSKGIWLRQRNGAWQAKVRQGGDFQNSQFMELARPEDISAVLGAHLGKKFDFDFDCGDGDGDGDGGSNAFGLGEVARFVTTRRAWRLNERYEVVVDDMDFGHQVGEVELQETCEIPKGTAGGYSDGTQRLDQELQVFMDEHRWAFPTDTPTGKLSAYFAKTKRQWG